MTCPARIVLIDDHQIIRDGLRLLLHGQTDFELAGNAYDTETGWELVQEVQPHLVVMDMNIPSEGGAALAACIREKFPETKILVLTAHTEPRYVQAALAAGANGYVAKVNGFLILIEAMRRVLAGRTYLCPEVSAVVVDQMQQRFGRSRLKNGLLSSRETEVLKQIAEGYSTKEIAFNLGVSGKTIETHRQNLMAKLEVDSVAELTKIAIREGLTTL
jgi:DNA-binding NarL/FixJ family response regulator